MCAHAVRVAVEKLPGVDSVRVSLNDGYADIALAPHNSVTIEGVRETIRKNGFSPRESRVRLSGTVAREGAALLLRLPSGVRFRLDGAPETVQQLAGLEGSSVMLDGDLPPSDGQAARLLPLTVERIEPVPPGTV